MDSVSEEIYTMGKNDGLEEGRMEGHAAGLATGLATGRAEGHAKGIEEGRMESLSGSARSMHRKGCSNERIAELLDVDIEMVQQWIEDGLVVS